MDLKNIGLKELLFLFLNLKGNKGNKGNKVCSSGLEKPDKFVLDSSIKKANKGTEAKSPEINYDVFLDFKNALNNYYDFQELNFDCPSNNKVSLEFINTKHLTISNFLKLIFDEISSRQLFVSTDDFSREFALAAFAFRGSFDLQRNFYTADLHKSRVSTKRDLEQFIKLLVLTNLNDQLNLNFRELQSEGTIRDTQFRMNLKYFNDKYITDLSKINPYRYKQFKMNANELSIKHYKSSKRSRDGFLDRVVFYMNNIVSRNKPLDKLDIDSMRSALNFMDNESNSGKNIRRSNKAKDFALLSKPDRCAGCHKLYDKSTRTFKLRNSNYWYFEMHHVISYANNKSMGIETENPDNYVKLCPACHRALTPNRAEKDYQFEIINNILNDDMSTLKYVLNVQKNVNNKESAEEFVYKCLQ